MQERSNGLTAALVLGGIWVVWHLPAFFISGMGQSQTPFWTFAITDVSVSVLMTWVVNRARGSVLPAILMHWSLNRFNMVWAIVLLIGEARRRTGPATLLLDRSL